MKSKKAQITWFIILGIVILLGAGTVIYIRNTTQGEITGVIPAGQEVRYQGEQEIRSFVDSCLRPIVLQGLEIQRLQGGYIELPTTRPKLTIQEKQENQQITVIDNSRKVVIDENGQGNEAPFWITAEVENNRDIAIPSKRFMEAELENYVTKELDKCVGNFQQFLDMGYKIEKSPITTNVSFGESIWVSPKLPLKVEIQDTSYEISDFNIEIPINMELIYNVASDLALYESMYGYLEAHSLDLIEKYSWRGGSKEQPTYLPPKRFTTAGFDCGQTTWTLEEVNEKLKNNYNQNFQYLKIAKTNFEREIRSNPVEQGVFDSYIENLLTGDYPTIHIDYIYDKDWFFNLDILPRSGNRLKPSSTSAVGIPMMPRFCTNKYRFKYTYDFPVLLKVKDDKSARIDVESNTILKGGGYEFHLPLWATVCGNQKRECVGTPSPMDLSSVNTTQKPTDFCKDSQKLSGDITITVKDSITLQPLKDVDVYYFGANSMQNCFVERTNDEGSITSKFPFCSGCMLDLFKEDYPRKRQRLDVMDYENKNIQIALDPFLELRFNVRLIRIPVFVRSWHETNGFTNADKMVELALEKGVYVDPNERSLSQLKNNGFVMAALIGETSPSELYNDSVLISGRGLNEFYYYYPDPENREVKLTSDSYKVSIGTTGEVNIKDTNYRYDDKDHIVDGFQNRYGLGPTIDYDWNIEASELRGKEIVTFYSLVEYTSPELNTPTSDWKMIDDSIMQDDTMKAELCYRKEAGVLKYRSIDGLNQKGDLSGCDQKYEVTITKEQYLPYILPKVS